jgi:uncharacterized membrane protein
MTTESSAPTRNGDLSSFLIGFCNGLRSATPLAAIAWAQKLGWMQSEGIFAKSASDRARIGLTAAAAGELVVDKLPFTPSRLETRGLVLRTLGGAFTGAAVAAANRGSPGRGALLGMAGSVIGSYAGYHYRVGAGKGLAKPAEENGGSTAKALVGIAVVEDVAAVLGSLLVLRGLRREDAEAV